MRSIVLISILTFGNSVMAAPPKPKAKEQDVSFKTYKCVALGVGSADTATGDAFQVHCRYSATGDARCDAIDGKGTITTYSGTNKPWKDWPVGIKATKDGDSQRKLDVQCTPRAQLVAETRRRVSQALGCFATFDDGDNTIMCTP